MVKPLLLIDLDRTLFNTDKFYPIILSTLAEMAGLTVSEAEKIYKGHNKGDAPGGLLHHNDFMGVLAELGVDIEAVRAKLITDTQSIDLTCQDAAALINWAVSQQKYETVLLSFGTPELQKIKAACCKPLSDMKLLTTLTRKYDYIAQNFSGTNGILVDDKDEQTLPGGWTEIHIDRSASSYSMPVKIADTIWRITDLKDVEEIIG